MTVCAGRFTPHASVDVDTNTWICLSANRSSTSVRSTLHTTSRTNISHSATLSMNSPSNEQQIYNVETSYSTQLKMCCLMTTFRCPSDILITSWLFTAQQLDEDKNAPHRREHYGLIEVHSDNHVLLFQGRHIPTDVRCRYGDPNFPASSQFVYGMAGEAGYCHGTGWMQTKI